MKFGRFAREFMTIIRTVRDMVHVSIRRRVVTAVSALVLVAIVPVSRSVRAEIAGGATSDSSGVANSARSAMGYLDVGDSHTCVVTATWSIVCVGSGLDGRLGTGATADVGDEPSETGGALQAVSLGTGRTARAVATGEAHTCALLDDGRVKCWGANGMGQLGLGDSNVRGDQPGEMGDALPFVNLGSGRTAVAIAAGGNHTCAVLDDGLVKCWGANSSGQLGISSTDGHGLKPSGMGDALPAVSMPGGRLAVAIAAGTAHSCAILNDSSLICWGEGVGGRLGQGNELSIGNSPTRAVESMNPVSLPGSVVAVAAGRFHTCAVLSDATLRCWGTGLDGRLGTGATDARGDQPGEMGASLPAINLGASRGVVAVAAGDSHTCAILDDASLRCFGSGLDGRLGTGATDARGDQPGEMGDSLLSVPVGAVVAVAAGVSHTCVLRWGGGARCVGAGGNGRLGSGSTFAIGDQPGEVAALGDAGVPSPATVATTTTTTSTTSTTTSTTTSSVAPTTTSTTTSTVAPTTNTPTTVLSGSSGGDNDRRISTTTDARPVVSSVESVVVVRASIAALPPFPLGQSSVNPAISRELARWASSLRSGAMVRCTAVGGTTTAAPSLALARAQAVCAVVSEFGHPTIVEVLPVQAARTRWRRSGARGALPKDASRRVLVEVADGTSR